MADPTKRWPSETRNLVLKGYIDVTDVYASTVSASTVDASAPSYFRGGVYVYSGYTSGWVLDIENYTNRPASTLRVTSRRSPGTTGTLVLDRYGRLDILASSDAAEVLRLRTAGTSTDSLVIQDMRDSSVVLAIDTDGNWTGTSPATSWKTFTPVLSGTSWDIGDGVIEGRYTKIGSTVTFRVFVEFGTTSTYGDGSSVPYITVCPPGVSMNLVGAPGMSFTAAYYRNSTGALYEGRAMTGIGTSSQVVLMNSGVSPMTGVTSTAPFAWANGNRIEISGTYESA